jgi:hypothetical protein
VLEVPGRSRTLLGGLFVAVVLALPFVVPRIGGIDTWKILLALAGLVVFRYGDRLVKR